MLLNMNKPQSVEKSVNLKLVKNRLRKKKRISTLKRKTLNRSVNFLVARKRLM